MPKLNRDEFCEGLVIKAVVAYASQSSKEAFIASIYTDVGDSSNTDDSAFRKMMKRKHQAYIDTHSYLDDYVKLHENYIDSGLSEEEAEQQAMDLFSTYHEKPEPKESFEAFFSTQVSFLMLDSDISFQKREPDDETFDSDLIFGIRKKQRRDHGEEQIKPTLPRASSGLIPTTVGPDEEQKAASHDDEWGFFTGHSDEENITQENAKGIRFFANPANSRPKKQVSFRIAEETGRFSC